MKKLPYILSLLILITTIFGSAPAQAQWSPQAKGAVIGGLGGAAAGALINKRNRAVGGVVGGVAGGAIGYGVGKHIDNKRKQRAAAAAEANRLAAIRAEERRLDARRSEARRETVLAANRSSQGAVPATAAVQPNTLPAVSNAAYLPNDTYGDASKPYSKEQIRRKSW